MTAEAIDYTIRHFSFSHSSSKSPAYIDTHIHDRYEIYYCLCNDLTYYIEGQAYKLNKNDIIFTNTHELHRIIFNSPQIYERKFIKFKPEYVSSFQTQDYNLLSFIEKRKLGYFNLIKAEDVISNEIDKLWCMIENEAKINTLESNILIKTYFVQILVSINRIFSKNEKATIEFYQNYENIQLILEYINKNLDTKITLDLLGQLFHVSKYYLCHIFKLNTGFTVVEYVTYKRIMKSQELLASGINMLDAANAVGFSDYSNFYKAFVKITGSSPKKYTKSFLKKS